MRHDGHGGSPHRAAARGFDHAVTAVIVFNTAALAASLIVDGHAGARFAGAVVFIR